MSMIKKIVDKILYRKCVFCGINDPQVKECVIIQEPRHEANEDLEILHHHPNCFEDILRRPEKYSLKKLRYASHIIEAQEHRKYDNREMYEEKVKLCKELKTFIQNDEE